MDRLNFVAGQLRVPDLKYTNVAPEDCRGSTRAFVQYMHDHPEDSHSALGDIRRAAFDDDLFSARSLNLMFLVDRCFDVWLRKSALDTALQSCLFPWRAQVFVICYESDDVSDLLFAMLELLDAMGGDLNGWCENPERAKKQVPQLINDTFRALCGAVTEDVLSQSSQRWQSYWVGAKARHDKTTQRLLDAESELIAKLFCDASAQRYINQQFLNKSLAPNVTEFLHTYWFNVLRRAFMNSDDSCLPAVLIQLGRKLKTVFCEKGKAALSLAPTLVDELSEAFDEYDVVVPESSWFELSEQIILILKGAPSPQAGYSPLMDYPALEGLQICPSVGYREGDWLIDTTSEIRMRVLKVFSSFGFVLLVNHLGMKVERVMAAELNRRISERLVKKLSVPAAFSTVFSTTLKGLNSVAETQSKARENAALKARNEAERLRAEQADAARRVREKAAEIAKRTKQISDRKEEAQRLDREQKVLEQISSMSLGAWVSITTNGDKQRYKLAVKFAAKKRYVFVDKYGIKKVEYQEPDLIADVISERVLVLSDGADFDESLERVIGRIRMSS